IEDSKVFTRPWKIAMPLYRRLEPNMQLLEYRCIEFVEEFLYGNLRKQQLVKHWEGDTLAVDITRKVPPQDRLYERVGRYATTFPGSVRNSIRRLDSMRTKLPVSIVVLGLFLTGRAISLSAHHSFAAEFDANKPVNFKGTVTKMEWVNPHVWLHLDVKKP